MDETCSIDPRLREPEKLAPSAAPHGTQGPPFAAVVLSADRTPDDPVAKAAGVSCKALAPVGPTPMLMRVLEALASSKQIGQRVVCGPSRQCLAEAPALVQAIDSAQIAWIPNEASPAQSAWTAMEGLPETTPVLLTTADHALLSAQMVDHFCGAARDSGCDLVVGVALQREVHTRYPELRRTVLRFRDGPYCSCNLFAFLTPQARAAAVHWKAVEAQRKNVARVVSILGWMSVVQYLLGRLSLPVALRRLSARMSVSIGAITMPFPEAAIDVDTVEDWRIVNALARDAA